MQSYNVFAKNQDTISVLYSDILLFEIYLYINPLAVLTDFFLRQSILPNTQNASLALDTATFIRFLLLSINEQFSLPP